MGILDGNFSIFAIKTLQKFACTYVTTEFTVDTCREFSDKHGLFTSVIYCSTSTHSWRKAKQAPQLFPFSYRNIVTQTSRSTMSIIAATMMPSQSLSFAGFIPCCFTGKSALPERKLALLAPNSQTGGMRRSSRIGASKRPRSLVVLAKSSSSSSPSDDAIEDEPVQYFSSVEPSTVPDTAPSTAPSFQSYAELPLFPLPLVLNPGSSMPLHIFEMRYRLMFNRIRDGNSKFGIVFYNKDIDAIASIGCSAELTQFEPMSDGRIMTNSVGKSRFRIVNILEDKPYKRALVEYFHDVPPTDSDITELADAERQVWNALKDVLRLSNKLYDKSLELTKVVKDLAPESSESLSSNRADSSSKSSEITSEAKTLSPTGKELSHSDIQRMEDFSFAVSQILDMPVMQQQLLLQTRSTIRRFQKQSKMLDTARQYLAAQVVIKDADLKF